MLNPLESQVRLLIPPALPHPRLGLVTYTSTPKPPPPVPSDDLAILGQKLTSRGSAQNVLAVMLDSDRLARI